MNVEKIILALSNLKETDVNSQEIQDLFNNAYLHNKWFTIEDITTQWKNISQEYFSSQVLQQVASTFSWNKNPLRIGIIAAGNIPMVVMHDLVCVLMSGNKPMLKLSSNDTILMTYIVQKINNSLGENYISIIEMLRDVDAVIATGSNQTIKTFKQYFNNKPHILRGSKTSIGVLNGKETEEDYIALGKDIFTHGGLGCRNLNMLLIPTGFEFQNLLQAFDKHYTHMLQNTKWMNNYEYQRTILLLNNTPHFSNNFISLKQDEQIFSPISVIHYQYYNNENEIENFILKNTEHLQCMVSKNTSIKIGNFSALKLGESQCPSFNDYADHINTMEWLSKL